MERTVFETKAITSHYCEANFCHQRTFTEQRLCPCRSSGFLLNCISHLKLLLHVGRLDITATFGHFLVLKNLVFVMLSFHPSPKSEAINLDDTTEFNPMDTAGLDVAAQLFPTPETSPIQKDDTRDDSARSKIRVPHNFTMGSLQSASFSTAIAERCRSLQVSSKRRTSVALAHAPIKKPKPAPLSSLRRHSTALQFLPADYSLDILGDPQSSQASLNLGNFEQPFLSNNNSNNVNRINISEGPAVQSNDETSTLMAVAHALNINTKDVAAVAETAGISNETLVLGRDLNLRRPAANQPSVNALITSDDLYMRTAAYENRQQKMSQRNDLLAFSINDHSAMHVTIVAAANLIDTIGVIPATSAPTNSARPMLSSAFNPLLLESQVNAALKQMVSNPLMEPIMASKSPSPNAPLPKIVVASEAFNAYDFLDAQDASSSASLPVSPATYTSTGWPLDGYDGKQSSRQAQKWTEEEDSLLMEGTARYGTEWGRIAQEFLPHRTGDQCLYRRVKSLNPSSRKKIVWTKHEDELLLRGYQKYGKRWAQIASTIPSRTSQQIKQRWSYVLNKKSKNGRWTTEENCRLKEGHQVFGKQWSKVCKMIPGRTSVQCRNRWKDVMDPKISTQAWSEDEDKLLLEGFVKFGSRWTKIAGEISGRTDLQCRDRLLSHSKRASESNGASRPE
jgi:hypothetical protein